jgi:hypothetical protein
VRASFGRLWTAAAVAWVCVCATGCGNSVKGHTYTGNGQLVSIQFQSGGKAYVSMGPMTSTCTYTQSGNNIALVCEGDTEQLALAGDGSLNGPPDGMLAHLTRVK